VDLGSGLNNQQIRGLCELLNVEAKPPVEPVFQQFGNDEAFEQASSLGMDGQMVRTLDVQQPGGQPAIIEVKLGRLDQPLSEILVVRPQQENNIAGFKDGYPAQGNVVGDAAVGRQGGKIEELARTAGAHPKELLERAQVPDIEDIADVPFEISQDIVRVSFILYNLSILFTICIMRTDPHLPSFSQLKRRKRPPRILGGSLEKS